MEKIFVKWDSDCPCLEPCSIGSGEPSSPLPGPMQESCSGTGRESGQSLKDPLPVFLSLRNLGLPSALLLAKHGLRSPSPDLHPQDSNSSPTRIWGGPRSSLSPASRPFRGPCLCREPPSWCSLSPCLALDVSYAFCSFLLPSLVLLSRGSLFCLLPHLHLALSTPFVFKYLLPSLLYPVRVRQINSSYESWRGHD